jgi:hypothetical protein
MLSVLSVSVDHMRLKELCPEFRDSHPIDPKSRSPINRPTIRAKMTIAGDRVELALWKLVSRSEGITQG